MKAELSPITPTKDSDLECHLKTEMNVPVLVDSPTGYVMTIDNTSYVTVEGARFTGDFRYLCLPLAPPPLWKALRSLSDGSP